MSISSAHTRVAKTRPYHQRRRAQKQAETRRRIVEAAVELHCTVGPAQTTVSDIAERAGVQRHTYYAHFPDERSLFLACSGLAAERDPLPAVDALRELPPGPERLRRGLELFYAWFQRNEGHAGCVLRDAEHHALTREMVELRIAPTFRKAAEVLGQGLPKRARALLAVALDFACWRVLAASHTPARAAALMADAIAALA